MATPQFLAGSTGAATIGGTAVAVTRWSVQPTTRMVEFINSQTGGFIQYQPTFKQGRVTIDLDFDFANNPFQAPTSIQVGSTLATVNLYLNGTSGKFWAFPTLIVESTPQTTELAGKVTTQVVCVISGTFTYPT